jgi:hypothetical protein
MLPGLVRAQGAANALEFVENRGQWDKRVRYAAPVAPGARLFVENAGLTYALTAGPADHDAAAETGAKACLRRNRLLAHALRVEFLGANPLIIPNGETPAQGQRHYLHGTNARQWGRGAAAWQQLRYHQLWPGTDVVLKASADNQLEYDVLLDAGADAAQVRLRYYGADDIYLDPKTGILHLQTSVGQLMEQAPRAWQTDPATGRRQPVACTFRLHGTEVRFELGDYEHGRPLVIDPVVQFASYTGSRVENWGFASTFDAAGNLYTAGVVFEPGYPVTVGAYQTTFRGNTDMAIMKFNTAVTGPGARVWATYLGGNNLDFPHSLLVNSRNELLLLGTTSSTDFPTTGTALGRSFWGGTFIAPGDTLPNGSDLVLTRLSASGGGLRASTYLGGSGNDGLLDPVAPAPRLHYNFGDAFRGDLALDPQGNVYVASVSSSADFPGLAAGAYRGGLSDGVVTSLDSSLSRVRWTTAVGGSAADAAYSIERDAATGDLLVAGGTTSPNLAAAAGGYRAAWAGGVDGFVARLTAAGSLVQTTYLGTAAYDQAYFVRLGPAGQVYVLGQTASPAWPGLTSTSYQNAGGRQFIQQLAPSLRAAGFATVVGSGRAMPDISPTAFGVDCYGRILLAGWGGGRNLNGGTTLSLPVTANAFQPTTDGRDFYLMQLSDQAQTLEYATFFGSLTDDHVDGGTSRFDPQGTLYQALCSNNQGRGIPIPAGANYYAATNNAPQYSNAAFKFALLANTSGAGIDTLTVCARGGAVRLAGSPAGGTWSGTGVSGTVATGFFFNTDSTLLGTHVLTYVSPLTGACAGTSTRRITVLPQLRAVLTTPIDTFCLLRTGPAPAPVLLTVRPPGGSLTGLGLVPGPTPGTTLFDPVMAGPGSHTISYQIAGGRCPALASVTMVVRTPPRITSGPPQISCLNDLPFSLGGIPAGGTWTGAGVSGSVNAGFIFTPMGAGVGTHVLTYNVLGQVYCDRPTDTIRVQVLPVGRAVRVPQDTAMCTTAPTIWLRGGTPGGGTWSGPGVSGTLTTGFRFTPRPSLVGNLQLLYTGPVVSRDTCPGQAVRRVLLRETQAQLSVPNRVVCALAEPQPLAAYPPGGTWSGPGVSGTAAAGFTFTPTPAIVGIVNLLYVGPAPANPTQCPSAGELSLTVVAVPLVLFDSIPPISLCQGLPPHGIQLVGQPAGGTFAGPGVAVNMFNPAQAGIGRHVITYTYLPPGLTCPVVVQRVVEVRGVPTITTPADTVFCGERRPFQLTATPGGGVWIGNGVTSTGFFTPPNAPGTVVLTYSLGSGCGSRLYRATVPDVLSFAASWTAPACLENHVAPRRLSFRATGSAAGQVRWDFGDGSAPVTGASVEHTYTAAGRYLPQAELPGGGAGPCQSQVALAPVEVVDSFLPNIITPNGDALNQTFAPRVGGCQPRLQVFSRWGQQVFDQANYQNTWDGAGLPAGIYYYLLTDAAYSTQLKGWVEIMR